MDPNLVAQLSNNIREAIRAGQLDVNNAFGLITKALELAQDIREATADERKQLAVVCIEEIAKGADGIAGTADDLIPATTVAVIRDLLAKNVVHDFVNVVQGAAHGQFNLGQIVAAATPIAVGCCGVLQAYLASRK